MAISDIADDHAFIVEQKKKEAEIKKKAIEQALEEEAHRNSRDGYDTTPQISIVNPDPAITDDTPVDQTTSGGGGYPLFTDRHNVLISAQQSYALQLDLAMRTGASADEIALLQEKLTEVNNQLAALEEIDSTTTTLENTSLAPQVLIYAGGDQIISDYQSGEQIFLNAMPTGYIFGGGNFAMTSATGTLFIANANDKIINFVDGAGNDFAKAYAATYPGVIDGRVLAGYEVINGSDYGADAIFAGDGGSQLWGGNGMDSDTLVGGAGADVFIGGKMQGSDVMMNAASTDVVFLNDALLGDIIAAAGDGGTVAIAFNTGNVVMVSSSEPLSAAFMLADGSAYRYNHVAQAWQKA